MKSTNPEPSGTRSQSALGFLEELRRIAQWGLSYTTDPYDIERYTRLLELAAIEYGALSGLPKDLLIDRFRAELGGNITPKVGVDAAIFDSGGRLLLIKRDDDQCWSVPGGWAELGETPQQSIAREVREETGLEVDVRELIGLYHRMPGEYGQPHTSYHLLFHCVVTGGALTTTPEALEVGYYDPDGIMPWHRDMAKVSAMALNWRRERGECVPRAGWTVGADGCRAGWCAVALGPDGKFETATYPSITSLWRHWAGVDCIFVDIPIGLPDAETGPRSVDSLARRLIGGRASSVFAVPCRDAVYAESYPKANEINRAVFGKGLSKQAWNICHLIRDVDELLIAEPSARERICESHPELIFYGLNDGKHLAHYKRTEEGFQERLAILARHLPNAAQVYTNIRTAIPLKAAARDDLIDALALAVAAREQGTCDLPENPPADRLGLPMRMVWRPRQDDRENTP